MKKLLALLLMLALCVGCAAQAENQAIDLNTLSREELVALRKEIAKKRDPLVFDAKWLSGETVTQEKGLYEIGLDIPEGRWKLQPSGNVPLEFVLATKVEKERASDAYCVDGIHFLLIDFKEKSHLKEYVIDCVNGMYLQLWKEATFTPVAQ